MNMQSQTRILAPSGSVEQTGTDTGSGNVAVTNAVFGSSTRDENNTNLSTLANGATWTGEWTVTDNLMMIVTSFRSSQTVTITMQFSSDGSTVHSSIGPYTLNANTNSPQGLTPTRKYYRVVVANSSGSVATLAVETRLYTSAGNLHSRFQDTPNQLTSAINSKSLTIGRTEGGGVFLDASMSPEGHQEIAIMAPRTAFGELAVASDVPGIQRSHFQYGFNTRLDRRTEHDTSDRDQLRFDEYGRNRACRVAIRAQRNAGNRGNRDVVVRQIRRLSDAARHDLCRHGHWRNRRRVYLSVAWTGHTTRIRLYKHRRGPHLSGETWTIAVSVTNGAGITCGATINVRPDN